MWNVSLYKIYSSTSDLTILTICCVILIINCYASYVMSLSLKRIKFENLVMLCGVMMSLVLIFVIITNWEILIFLILFCQILIYLFILRRFSRIYFRIKRGYEGKKHHNNLYSKAVLIIFLILDCFM
jgi:hypothetical protein